MVFDVSDEAQVKKAMDCIRKDHGPIDILINSAGIIFLGSLEDISSDQWDKVLDINLKGTFLLSKEVAASMKKRKKGWSW